MEVISRANIYKKIELAKEFLKNVAACEDTVVVLDNVQSALEEEKVYYIMDGESGQCVEIKKCKCGGTPAIMEVYLREIDNKFVVIMGCNKCGRGIRVFKANTLMDVIEKWNNLNIIDQENNKEG